MVIFTQSTITNAQIDRAVNPPNSGISCSECRRRKVRCGRELPTCSACIKFDFTCIYSNSSHRRHNRLKLDNMSKLTFSQGKQEPKAKITNMADFNSLTSTDLVQHYKTQSKITFKLMKYAPFNDKLNDKVTFYHQDLVKHSSGSKFNPHLTIMLLGQILDNNPWIGSEVDWFLNNVKLGIFGGTITAHIKIDNSWIKELYNQNFQDKVLENYFQYFHPWFSYFGKRLFYSRLNCTNSVLLSVLIFVGYQYTSNHHKELLKYLEHLATIQLKKHMYKVSISNCQALYIFSYSMLLRGLAKQSLPYYNQACSMSSALGIHLNISGLDAALQNERMCIRSIAIMQDQHLISTLNLPSYMCYMDPSSRAMDPIFQIAQLDPTYSEVVEAECISLLRWVYDRYWMVVTSKMHELILKQDIQKNDLSPAELRDKCDYFGVLYDKCLIVSCETFLDLTYRFYTDEAKIVIEKYIRIFTCNYYQWIILIYSQQKPEFDPVTKKIDYHTQRALRAVRSIFKLVTTSKPSTLYLYYHYLSAISFFYLNLYLNSMEYPHFQCEIQSELSQIYEKFIAYKEEYSFSNDCLLALVEILKFLKIKV